MKTLLILLLMIVPSLCASKDIEIIITFEVSNKGIHFLQPDMVIESGKAQIDFDYDDIEVSIGDYDLMYKDNDWSVINRFDIDWSNMYTIENGGKRK